VASLSFRDRFFSPQVGRVVTSPSAILALGAGAAVGVLATISTGGLAAPIVAGIAGGALGYGGRVALAIPKKGKGPEIDPFAVDEPWRYAVRDAIRAKGRLETASSSFRKGPLADSMVSLSAQLDDAVEEVWRVAQGGQRLSEARKQINDREVRWELQRAEANEPTSEAGQAIKDQIVESLNQQLASAKRIDDLLKSTFDELTLLNSRLDQAVTQSVELSVSSDRSTIGPVGADLTAIVDRLGALGQAMNDLSQVPSPPPPAPPNHSTQT